VANFKVNGKEETLKVNYEGVKYLNKIAEADTDYYSHVILAGLNHTGEPYTLADVKQAIERLDLHEVKRLSDEIVIASRIYNSFVEKMLYENTRVKKKRGK
jgi:hypothetical protein